jgi:hypothetical protein
MGHYRCFEPPLVRPGQAIHRYSRVPFAHLLKNPVLHRHLAVELRQKIQNSGRSLVRRRSVSRARRGSDQVTAQIMLRPRSCPECSHRLRRRAQSSRPSQDRPARQTRLPAMNDALCFFVTVSEWHLEKYSLEASNSLPATAKRESLERTPMTVKLLIRQVRSLHYGCRAKASK